MSYYNGFSDPERDYSLYWLYAMIRRGVWRKTERCEACGQTEGIIDWHREDYNPPFGSEPEDQHRGQFELCFRCHMMIHTRMWAKDGWDEYRKAIREGIRFAAMKTRNFPGLLAQHVRKSQPVAWTQHEPPTRCVLDEIDAGLHCPPGRIPGNSKEADPNAPPFELDEETATVVAAEKAMRRDGWRLAKSKTKAKDTAAKKKGKAPQLELISGDVPRRPAARGGDTMKAKVQQTPELIAVQRGLAQIAQQLDDQAAARRSKPRGRRG